MECSKMALAIKKLVKKDMKERIHIKTEKLVHAKPIDSDEIQQTLNERNKKRVIRFRHTSVLSRKESVPNNQIVKREDVSSRKSHLKMDRKFPQIFHPSASSSQKYFDFQRFEGKFKTDTQHLANEKKKAVSEYIQSKQRRHQLSAANADLTSASKNVKLSQIQPLKQMYKQKKIQLFKAIRYQFNSLINTSNNLSITNQDISFKAFVQKGNNGILVKQILKKRWWWHVEEDRTKANLIWTEWFDKNATAKLNGIVNQQQTISTQQYKTKVYQQGHNKHSAILKLVDNQTFNRLQKRININSNTYFKIPKNQHDMLLNDFRSAQNSKQIRIVNVNNDQLAHNHVEGCLNLHSKKLLFMNFHNFMIMKNWDPFAFLPLTFYIQSRNSSVIENLLKKFSQFEELRKQQNELKNIWICKPGQNSNRGCGIKVVKTKQQLIQEINLRLPEDNVHRSVIIQKYIEKCFLINNRKFDIRCYILLTTVNGILKGYWYKDGYIRTSSIEYSLQDTQNQMIHLTNDAIQKKGQDFGKHQDSNKLSFDYFKQYLKKTGNSPNKFDETYEKMKLIAYYLIASVSTKIKRKQYTFQLFGLDFMLEQNLNPILIEANSNPCLSNHGKILGKLIHELVENVIMTAIDPIFPPPTQQKKKTEQLNKDYFSSNKFQLIFTSKQKAPTNPSAEMEQN